MKNEIQLKENSEGELPLIENDLSNIEKYLIELADKKIKDLMTKFDYMEDKITFNENDFLSLFKNDEKIINLNLNSKEFNDLIYNIGQIKSYEYNKLLVEQLPSWNKLKINIKNKLDSFCDFFYKSTITKAIDNNNYKFDINEFDNELNSLYLYNGVKEYKYNEIKELIRQNKENFIIKINNNLDQIKKYQEYLEKNVCSIMRNISDYFPRNYTLDNKIYILANELLKSLKNFADSCDGVSLYLEIEKEIKIKAKNIARNFLSQNMIRPPPLAFPHSPSPPPNSEYFPTIQYNGISFLDGLRSIGVCTSFGYIRKIAETNGIIGYIGMPRENIQMLYLLKAGKLIKPKI